MTISRGEAGQDDQAVAEGTPQHGNQGDRGPQPAVPEVPASLTIAISREAGSRGGSIARRVSRKLGWEVYNQELLEYISQQGTFNRDVSDDVSPAASAWIEARLVQLQREMNLSDQPSLRDVARAVLALGAKGDVILIGRGAGCLVPPESTLNVRIVAPLADRIAYMSQWLRLTVEQAAEQVRQRDARRAEFLSTHFRRQAGDLHQYDLLLNSSLLGEALCAELIAQAARAKRDAWLAARESA